jgi:hypothetical protein
LNLFESLPAPRQFFGDGFDGRRPNERFGMLVPLSEKFFNGGDQFVDAVEGAAANALVGQFRRTNVQSDSANWNWWAQNAR